MTTHPIAAAPPTAEAIVALLSGHGVADRIAAGLPHRQRWLREAVVESLAAVLRERLGPGLSDALLTGYTRLRELHDAAERSLGPPATEQVVALDRHRLGTDEPFTVDVLVDDRPVTAVACRLAVEFDVTSLAAVIRAGRWEAAQIGACTASATLTVQGVRLPTVSRDLELLPRVEFRPGIVLARAAPARAEGDTTVRWGPTTVVGAASS